MGALKVSAEILSEPVRNSSPSVQRLNTNLMSKAVPRLASTFASASSVKPLDFSVETLMAGACFSVP